MEKEEIRSDADEKLASVAIVDATFLAQGKASTPHTALGILACIQSPSSLLLLTSAQESGWIQMEKEEAAAASGRSSRRAPSCDKWDREGSVWIYVEGSARHCVWSGRDNEEKKKGGSKGKERRGYRWRHAACCRCCLQERYLGMRGEATSEGSFFFSSSQQADSRSRSYQKAEKRRVRKKEGGKQEKIRWDTLERDTCDSSSCKLHNKFLIFHMDRMPIARTAGSAANKCS